MGTIARGAKAGGGTNLNSGQTADPAEVNTDFNTIVTEINGNLDDANIETATLPGAKSFRFTEISDPSSPSSNDLLVYSKDNGAGRTKLYTKDAAGSVVAVGYERLVGATSVTGGRIPAVIASGGSQVGTDANTTEKILHTLTIGANVFHTSASGNTIHVTANGTLAANGNNKTVNVRLNGVAGTIVVGTGVVTTSGAMWDLDIWITANSPNLVDVAGVLRVGAAGAAVGATTLHRSAYALNAAVTHTSAWTVDITGLNGTASASDVTCRWSRAMFWPVTV